MPTMRCLVLVMLSGLGTASVEDARQELDRAALENVKAATTYVFRDSERGRISASGFLFVKRGRVGYVITSDRMAETLDKVRVVFGSGTASERSFEGDPVADNPYYGVGCVILKGAKDLPSALELGDKTTVAETETVYAAGFPFGGSLAKGRKNPEISVIKSSVSSVRRDPGNRIKAIQMTSDVSPGLSGGPVVDTKGRVVGIVQGGLAGTSTSFAVPLEAVHTFLQGHAGGLQLKVVASTAAAVRCEAALRIVDPFATLKGVGIAWCFESVLAARPQARPEGTWDKVHASMKALNLKIEEDRASGAFDVERGDSEFRRRKVLVQAFHSSPDGQTHWSAPLPLDVEFAEAESKEVQRSENLLQMPIGNSVTALATLRLRAAVAELILSPDGGALYALDLSEGKVYQLNPDTLQIVAQADALENATCMCLSLDGKTLIVGGRSPSTRKDAGQVLILPTSGLGPARTFRVPFAIHDLAVTNGGMIVASGLGLPYGMALIDSSKGQMVVKLSGDDGRSRVRLHPDQERVYFGYPGVRDDGFQGLHLRKEEDGHYPTWRAPRYSEAILGGDFEISPDGLHLIGCRGAVLKIGKSKDSDLTFVGKIEPGVAIGVSKGSRTFVVASAQGFLKFYDLPDVTLRKTLKVDRLCSRVALDASKRRIYAVASPPIPAGPQPYGGQPRPAADIMSFSILEK